MKQIDHMELRNLAESKRKKIGLDRNSPIDFSTIISLLPNITLVEYPLSQSVRGVILKDSNENAIIAINSKMQLHRFYFTFAHELYHYFTSSTLSKACPLDESARRDIDEVKADVFASYFLMPRESFMDFFENICGSRVNVENIIRISNYYRVNYGLVIRRLADEHLIDKEKTTDYSLEVIKNLMHQHGYPIDLYCPRRDDDKIVVTGKYISLAYKLFNSDKIGESKLDELLDLMEIEH